MRMRTVHAVDMFGVAAPEREHRGQHQRCVECNVLAADTWAHGDWKRGHCSCDDPIVEYVPMWGTNQCGRCGREIRP